MTIRIVINKLTLTFISLFLCNVVVVAQNLADYVQPLAGTARATTKSATKHGAGTELNANVIPAVTQPFAMTQWTPETRQSEIKCLPPYLYSDTLFNGFRASHWLSGSCTQDYGSLTIMPLTGSLNTLGYATPFKHSEEKSSPYYYHVNLPAYGVNAEVTATLRSGMLQFTAQKNDSLYVLIKPNSDRGEGFVQIDADKGLVWGYNPVHRIYQGWGKPAGFSGYFVVKVEGGFTRRGVFRDGKNWFADTLKGGLNSGAFIGLQVKAGQKVRLRIGTSFSSFEGALLNLNTEITHQDFESLVKANKNGWEKALGKIKVTTSDERSKRIFYTAMYHAMQQPRLFNDVDGSYPQFAGNYKLLKIAGGNYYDDFSMWDTYRTQMPLFEVLEPALVNDCVRSMILKGQQGGWMPVFPCWNSFTAAMIGDHVTAFIASAYVRGIRDYDVKAAYSLMRQNAFKIPTRSDYVDGKGRRALDSYLKYGYIPLEDSVPDAFHKKEQVSRTLEYAFDDYALAQVARGIGVTADYEVLIKRARNYLNVFDPSVKMVRGRYIDGSWVKPFHANLKQSYITEGTPQQYTFYAPQDINGLAKAMGGPHQLELSLDKLFETGEYWHGNEPGQQIPFMFTYTSSPWKTQRYVHEILNDEYNDGPGGLSGNDDAGQMSAWYVMAALGFYPVNPASDHYILSAPIFNSYQINLPGKIVFKVVVKKRIAGDIYIKSVKLNGKRYTRSYIKHSDITNGGVLELTLSATPNKNWAINVADRPPSLSK
ncbi:GH92 family glycosyl hydrolase [Mucilaginibacter roseus]|uniref:GH92 family glycosyl hydrolase n=1 Tax=Mucilaginibacter roseus TaxID=1528868 RepID=A0ABS8TYI1_9SPHI|nr:GH92 family glycosyl hydrolase [Mucilaginibacter roseus]MCD8739933.1 GH92 family glycosyl hydrolase [Mucilaginibacter roseus]